MKTVRLDKDGTALALLIQAERDGMLVEAKRLQDAFQKDMDTLRLEGCERMRQLWDRLLISQSIDPTRAGEFNLDMNYLQDHALGFLRPVEPVTLASEAVDPIQAAFTNLGNTTKH